MRALALLGTVFFVGLALFFIAVWAVWYDTSLGEFVTLPIRATDLPGGPTVGSFGAAGVSFVVAYLLSTLGRSDDE